MDRSLLVDGRFLTVLFGIVLPAVGIGVTIVYFSMNPVSLFALFAAMVAGSVYLLTYKETF